MKTANRTVFVPELNGSIEFTDNGGFVHRNQDHWFIEREERTDEEIINAALDELEAGVRPSILLSSGKLVTHHMMPNGAQEARINGVPEMSESEWTEYCAKLRSELVPSGWKEIEA